LERITPFLSNAATLLIPCVDDAVRRLRQDEALAHERPVDWEHLDPVVAAVRDVNQIVVADGDA